MYRQIIECIRRGLDEKAISVLKSNSALLTQRDCNKIIGYIEKKKVVCFEVLQCVLASYDDVMDGAFHRALYCCMFRTAFDKSDYFAVRSILENYIPSRNSSWKLGRMGVEIDSALKCTIDSALKCTMYSFSHVGSNVVSYVLEYAERNGIADSAVLRSVLYYASDNGYTNIIEHILDICYKISPDLEKTCSLFALSKCIIIACQKNQLEVLKMLIVIDGVDLSYDNILAIRRACEGGYIEIIRILLEDSRVIPTALNNDAFRLACQYNRSDVVQLLLADSRITSSLHLTQPDEIFRSACNEGSYEMVVMLWNMSLANSFAKPIDPNYGSMLANACEFGYPQIVKFLLSIPATDPSKDENRALLTACIRNRFDMVQMLVEDKRLNMRGGMKDILQMATDPRIIKLLLDKIDCQEHGIIICSLLKKAAKEKSVGICKAFLKHPAVQLNRVYLIELLQLACEMGRTSMAELIVKHYKIRFPNTKLNVPRAMYDQTKSHGYDAITALLDKIETNAV